VKNPLDLSGKTALITGASSGIGAATAELFAHLGAQVAIGYNKNAEGAAAVHQRITAAVGRAITIEADVSAASEAQRVVKETLAAFGQIDILVNNAGSLIERKSLLDVSEQLWDEVMSLNLKSALICSRVAAPAMLKRKRGTIVNIVSIAGRNGGGPGAGAYATAKGALITLTKALAKEFAPHNVRVNAVSPGVIDTPFHETFSTPEMIRNFVSGIPMGRVGTSLEVAHAIAFMASDAASYITGETLEVNGGQLML
jgi:3-oxoacyl-[acyl-carrier protein] reductase